MFCRSMLKREAKSDLLEMFPRMKSDPKVTAVLFLSMLFYSLKYAVYTNIYITCTLHYTGILSSRKQCLYLDVDASSRTVSLDITFTPSKVLKICTLCARCVPHPL